MNEKVNKRHLAQYYIYAYMDFLEFGFDCIVNGEEVVMPLKGQIGNGSSVSFE